MNRRELLIQDSLRVVVQSPLKDQTALYTLYHNVASSHQGQIVVYDIKEHSRRSRNLQRTYLPDNPELKAYSMEKYFSSYVDFFKPFHVKEIRIDKYDQKTYTQGGVFILLGNARIKITQGSKILLVNFKVTMGDLLSVIGDDVTISVASEKGQMYAVHFTEDMYYEDEDPEKQSSRVVRTGTVLPSGRRVGYWSIEYPESGVKESGSYDQLGRKTGMWVIEEPHYGTRMFEGWADGKRFR